MSDEGEVYHDWVEDRDAGRPAHYREIYWGERTDISVLPAVDYNHFAYSEWNIRISLYTMGVREEYWPTLLKWRKGPQVTENEWGEKVYVTLLYKVASSSESWGRYSRIIVDVYTGFLRDIVKSGDIEMVVTAPLIESLGNFGSYFLYSNLYEYRLTSLDASGYCYYHRMD